MSFIVLVVKKMAYGVWGGGGGGFINFMLLKGGLNRAFTVKPINTF